MLIDPRITEAIERARAADIADDDCEGFDRELWSACLALTDSESEADELMQAATLRLFRAAGVI